MDRNYLPRQAVDIFTYSMSRSVAKPVQLVNEFRFDDGIHFDSVNWNLFVVHRLGVHRKETFIKTDQGRIIAMSNGSCAQ